LTKTRSSARLSSSTLFWFEGINAKENAEKASSPHFVFGMSVLVETMPLTGSPSLLASATSDRIASVSIKLTPSNRHNEEAKAIPLCVLMGSGRLAMSAGLKLSTTSPKSTAENVRLSMANTVPSIKLVRMARVNDALALWNSIGK